MRIDLKKLAAIEASMCLDGTTSTTSLFALQEMLRLVLQYKETGYQLATTNVKMAYDTLKQLGVIKDTPNKEVQQLNS
jgi:hypothetical protein